MDCYEFSSLPLIDLRLAKCGVPSGRHGLPVIDRVCQSRGPAFRLSAVTRADLIKIIAVELAPVGKPIDQAPDDWVAEISPGGKSRKRIHDDLMARYFCIRRRNKL